MFAPYAFLKACLDPVVFLLILIVIGFLVSLGRGKKRSGPIILPVTFLVLYIVSISPVSNALCYIIEKDYLLQNNAGVDYLDIVVVLGGGVSDNQYLPETIPSDKTASRLLYAVQVFRKTGAKYLVFAGKGTGRISEAEVMKGVSVRLGVSPYGIKVDPVSRNTWEHAEELNKMFQNKDMKIGLVTSAYHMKRSERVFRKYFSHVIPLPSDYLYSSSPLSIMTFLPASGNLYKFSTALHEMIGVAWYRIKG